MSAVAPCDCVIGTAAGAVRRSDELARQARLVSALRAVLARGHCHDIALVETHISYVLLTGRFAYKIKKAVSLGFLEFGTLAARRFFCDEELRLNRRLAPETYVDVVPITGSVEAPLPGGTGPAIEYALRMREFGQDELAESLLARGLLLPRHIDALAARVAAFHGRVDVAPVRGTLGAPDAILRLAAENFTELRPLQDDERDLADLDALAAWTRAQHADCASAMAQRRAQGFVRECHGDLHLGNVAIVDGAPLIFDCIEFSDELRWIDVMNEVAFMTMDLQARGRPDLAQRFLNAYLEITGDYAGLAVLRFYLVYRALVRAKVACLRAAQLGSGDVAASRRNECRAFIRLANELVRAPHPALVITHGLSGSGKTTLSQALLEQIGAVRVRTDVERKRIHAVASANGDPAAVTAELYTGAATRRTYRRVLALAQHVLAAGYPAIVDGAFLKLRQRRLARVLAARLDVPFAIVASTAREATLRQRIARRRAAANDASDADLAILDRQLRTQEPLAPFERAEVFVHDAGAPPPEAAWRRWYEQLEASGRRAHPAGSGSHRAAGRPGPR
jgi:aminoglycoside phosphotransferase family enzyme/predicted kinase